MKVSVICPNHGRDISVLKMSLPLNVELIHVNEGLERSEQRNIGIARATGEAFLILDSDQSISPGLIRECVDIVQNGFTCVYIPEVIVANSWFGKIRKFEREFYTGTAVDVPRFVLRDSCPLFDKRIIGPEDADWANRISGFRAISHGVLYHHDDINLWDYIKKKVYYTKSMKSYAKKWPNDKCLNFKYRCFTVFTEKGKWKKILRHPLLSIGIIFIIIIRGIIYVRR